MGLQHTLVALGLAASFSVSAGNWNFLEFGPVNYFSERDFEIFQQTVNDALEHARDSEVRRWSNPDSGAFGSVKLLSSYKSESTPCRRAEISNNVKKSSGVSRFDFCKQPDGEWKIAPRPR
jgi:surface antigen